MMAADGGQVEQVVVVFVATFDRLLEHGEVCLARQLRDCQSRSDILRLHRLLAIAWIINIIPLLWT